MNRFTGKVALSVRIAALLLSFVAVVSPPAASAQMSQPAAGEVVYYRGAIGVSAPGGGLRIVGTQSPIYVGDRIQTSADGFAVVHLLDDSRVMLRPGSLVEVRRADSMELAQGGVRATIAELSQLEFTHDNVRISAPGGEVVARLCRVDCSIDASSGGKRVSTPATQPTARVVLAVGEVQRIDVQGVKRVVHTGSPVGEGDSIETGAKSLAAVVFSDGARVSVEPNSRYLIEQYKESAGAPQDEVMRTRLASGGARMMTGGIAQRRAESFRMQTPVALIGVRGTGFDVVEASKCGNSSSRQTLTASVWRGIITLLDQGADVKEGETICVPEVGAQVVRNVPAPQMQGQRPDTLQVPADLFTATSQSGTEEGLHVSAVSGEASVESDNGTLILGAGEDAFVTGNQPIRVVNELSPGFSDPFGELNLSAEVSVFEQFTPDFGLLCPAN